MPPGLDKLQHIVVLMMENRSFDHMLGSLEGIGGIDDAGAYTNPNVNNNKVVPQALADFQGQLNPDPDHHFPAVDLQIYGGATGEGRTETMDGFVASYYHQQENAQQAQKILYYFPKEKLPVLTTLATDFAVFNRWFASIPGPTICNRAFAHYGTSFGRVDMNPFDVIEPIKSIYTRLVTANPKHKAKVYYYDTSSSSMEVPNLLQNQPDQFGTYDQFLSDCDKNMLPDYSFVEPNYSDHDTDDGEKVANDQHPDHDVLAGEKLIAEVYTHIKGNPQTWSSTALLVVYDEHGGIFDHVPTPGCTPDGYSAGPADTQLSYTFNFDRLGVRVPAILISPWVPKGTVVGTDRIFEHASIPNTVTKHFIGPYPAATAREQAAQTFLDLLSLPTMRTDSVVFSM